MIERLELRNFTVFAKLDMDFSPKINVIIGENGSGKTHLLKAAYALCAGAPLFKNNPETSKDEFQVALTAKLLRLFMPLDDKLDMICHQGASDPAKLTVKFAQDSKIEVNFHKDSESLDIQNWEEKKQNVAEAVFIPTKEVLSLVRGIADGNHDQKTVDLIFDAGYVDLANALLEDDLEDLEAKINDDPRLNSVIPALVSILGGRYQWENGAPYFQAGKYLEKDSPKRTNATSAKAYQDSTVTEFESVNGQIYSSSMTAEGFRKIGILHRLLSNGRISPGSSGPLFWDEPESNINPKLMKAVVQILLELARNGQQIILATHDYVLLKWFDLLMDKGDGDHVRFHALSRDMQGNIENVSVDEYLSISPNAIADAFNDLTREQVNVKMGGLGK